MPFPQGTVTFLFTDIEGSARLWEQHPAAMSRVLACHDAFMRQAIETNGGHVFKTVGDAFCAVFAMAPEAVAAALEAQRTLHGVGALLVGALPDVGAPLVGALPEAEGHPPGAGHPPGMPLRVRMALHTGAAEERDGDYFGPPLNRVARILAAAHGGQMLLSSATEEKARDGMPAGASVRDLGVRRLRDLAAPERIFQLLHPDLPAGFPPLRSLEAFAHNLPIQLTSFIGREREIAAVKRLLASTRLLTLTGAGGCGKTRLTLQVAAELVEECDDGVWLVELAALADPALVPQAAASALGVREEPGRSLVQTLADYLQPRALLLVLDNCEHLLSPCAELAEGLLRACPRLRILASSREAFGIAGEQTYRVPSLFLPDIEQAQSRETLYDCEAVRLFTDRATLSQPTFAVTNANAAAVAQVCQRLDGIPLAIELAAARLKVLPVEQIVVRLDDRFRLLTGGSRTALPRQQTLRALIDWSYDLLSEEERALLRRLSVFAGGWTLEAAEAVCAGDGIGEWELLDLLSRLVDKSLVIVEEAADRHDLQHPILDTRRPVSGLRYRLLETVRQYGRDRLSEAEETPMVRSRHLDYFLRLVERAEPELHRPEQVAWLDRLEADHDNLRSALEWCQAAAGCARAGLRLGGALSSFWVMRGQFAEGRQWLEGVLARSSDGPASMPAKALGGAGVLAYFQGDYPASRRFFEDSLALARAAEEGWGAAFALFGLGIVAVNEGDFERATALSEESLALSRQIGDPWLIAHPLLTLGIVALAQGQFVPATQRYHESLALLRQVGDKWDIANLLLNLGLVSQCQGVHEPAREFYQEGLALCQELRDKRGIDWCLCGLAGTAMAAGQPGRAARLMGAAEKLRGSLQIPLLLWRTLHDRTLADARSALGEAAFAAAWTAGQAMPLDEAVADALNETGSWRSRAGG